MCIISPTSSRRPFFCFLLLKILSRVYQNHLSITVYHIVCSLFFILSSAKERDHQIYSPCVFQSSHHACVYTMFFFVVCEFFSFLYSQSNRNFHSVCIVKMFLLRSLLDIHIYIFFSMCVCQSL